MVLSILERAISDLSLSNRRVIVAASGGLDSTVLLHGLARLAARAQIELSVAHVNHGLRGEASEADQELVRQLTDKCALPFHTIRIDPESLREGGTSRTRPTLQEAARRLRYEALHRIASEQGAQHVATAHHLDDQAETVLMRIFRGCSPGALGGIAEVSSDGKVIRPLLRASRADLREYALAQGLEWREDASNGDPKYTRNHLRNDWLPGLSEAFNPRLARAIGDLAESQRRDNEWIEALVNTEAERRVESVTADEFVMDCRNWQNLPAALERRLVSHTIRSLGGGRDLSRRHVDRVIDFIRDAESGQSGKCLELPGGLRIRREAGRARFLRSRGEADSSC